MRQAAPEPLFSPILLSKQIRQVYDLQSFGPQLFDLGRQGFGRFIGRRVVHYYRTRFGVVHNPSDHAIDCRIVPPIRRVESPINGLLALPGEYAKNSVIVSSKWRTEVRLGTNAGDPLHDILSPR